MDRESFNPQVGELVQIRAWDDMKKEFGLNDAGNIACSKVFTKHMRYLEGLQFVITDISDNGCFEGYESSYMISKDMLMYPDGDDYDESEELEVFLNSFSR